MGSQLKYISSKLIKTQIVLRNKELSKSVPKTQEFTEAQLIAMLKRYGMVYVKPDKGSAGVGVMRVEKKGEVFRYQNGVQTLAFTSSLKLLKSIQQHIGESRYLVQRGIHMLRYHGRPFDFRVMIQKNPSGKWETTGIAGRVAHPRKAVTNGSQGGTIYPAGLLVKPAAALLKGLDRIAHLTAVQFSLAYPRMNELGIDIAVDHHLKPWILEVNTRPDPCPFTKLADQKMLNKIVAYGKAYGRKYCLHCNKAKSAPRN